MDTRAERQSEDPRILRWGKYAQGSIFHGKRLENMTHSELRGFIGFLAHELEYQRTVPRNYKARAKESLDA